MVVIRSKRGTFEGVQHVAVIADGHGRESSPGDTASGFSIYHSSDKTDRLVDALTLDELARLHSFPIKLYYRS